uniref:Metacaspase-1-like n=1 Tax=Nicotiana tabacum TaxID=4097 RepID=A0A1S4BAA4_TOBAC|nr:PREDICTED: metacaspase-1-like [Nicotiana tabacum]
MDCTNCHTTLQIPNGAQSIRCAVCHAVSRIGSRLQLLANKYHYPQLLSPFGRKRAVVIGIAYKNTDDELVGCINDAKCMKYLLVNRFNFPQDSILMLTEEERDKKRMPTKHNIIKAMSWLMQGVKAGDSLVFHFSGHGSQQENDTGDEIDGYDETLCPLDYEKQGEIVDDELNAILVKPLPPGAKLHAIIDACHSGTMLDLPFLCRTGRTGRYVWEDHRPLSGAWKGTNGGEVISFSGCDDHQNSKETENLSKVTSTGAMTFSFIQAIERGQGTTYGSILNAMRTSIRRSDSDLGGKIVTTLLTMLINGGSLGSGERQEPQLTANEPFDVYTKPFSL